MCVSFEGIHLIIMGLGGVLFTNGLDQTLSMHSSNFLLAVLEGGVVICLASMRLRQCWMVRSGDV